MERSGAKLDQYFPGKCVSDFLNLSIPNSIPTDISQGLPLVSLTGEQHRRTVSCLGILKITAFLSSLLL